MSLQVVDAIFQPGTADQKHERLPGFGVVVHTGRRTHRQYRTPVNVFRRADRYIIALTYGPDADWVRNVRASGGCELETRGHTLRLTIQSADAPHLTPPVPQALDSFGGTIQIWHDAKHESQLVIPVRGAARPAAPRTHACAARHRLTVRVRQPRHGRIVRVEAFVNGKLARRARGRRITRVRLGHLPRGRLSVRLVEHTSSGRRIVTVRTYSGCAR